MIGLSAADIAAYQLAIRSGDRTHLGFGSPHGREVPQSVAGLNQCDLRILDVDARDIQGVMKQGWRQRYNAEGTEEWAVFAFQKPEEAARLRRWLQAHGRAVGRGLLEKGPPPRDD